MVSTVSTKHVQSETTRKFCCLHGSPIDLPGTFNNMLGSGKIRIDYVNF